MANNASELERLFITLIADDTKLEESYRRVVTRAKQVADEVSKAFEAGAGKGFVDAGAKVEQSAQRQKKALDPVKAALEAVKNETASLRNEVEAGATTNDVAIKRFNELQTSALRQAAAFEVTSKEYRGFTQAAAQASRSIATLEGRATKLGFSANAAVGISTALRQNFSQLGPAGDAAARGLGIAQLALGGFARTGPGVTGVLGALVNGFRQLSFVLPLVGAAASAAAILGLVRLGNAAAEVADTIDKGSQAAGLSAEAYQEIRYAFDQSGVSADQFDKALQTLNRRIGQAADGNESLAGSFSRLGVSIRDVSTGAVRDTEKVFSDAVEAISRLPSAAQQAAAASELFGDRIGSTLLPALANGVEGIDALREAARSAGLIISGRAVLSLVEYKDAMATLKGQFEAAKTEIVAGFIPAMTQLFIPLIQNTIVPILQNAALAVGDFTQKFLDQTDAGDVFRTELANSIEPIVRLGAAAIGVGSIIAVAFQGILAAAAGLGAGLGTLISQIENEGFLAVFITDLERLAEARRRAVADAAQPFTQGVERAAQTAINAFTFDLQSSLNNLSTTLAPAIARGGRTVGTELAEEASSSFASNFTLAPPPVGSLAAFRAEASAARAEFERAVTDEAARGALEREAIALAEIARITSIYAEADPLAGARTWTERLGTELEFGLKNAGQVVDLLLPRVEELRAEARVALETFGFDSAEFAKATGQLELLEALLNRIGTTPVVIKPTVDISEAISIPTPDLLVDVSGSLAALNRQLQDARAAFLAAVTESGREAAFAAVQELEAQIAEIERRYKAIDIRITPTVEIEPLRTIALPDVDTRIAGTLADLENRLTAARIAFRNAATQAGREAADALITSLEAEIADLKRPFEAIDIRIVPTVTIAPTSPDTLIREDLAKRFEVAAAAAALFGTESELASVKVGLLENAMQALLARDPTADLTDLAEQWAEFAAAAADATAAAERQRQAIAGLEAGYAELAQLTGEAPTQFDNLERAFRDAGAAGLIAADELERLLGIVRELARESAATKVLTDLAADLDLGTQVVDGLTAALDGIKTGDIVGAIGGLTNIGVAIGTAIGGPAAGALVGAIGGALQGLVRLGQTISDFFTGDSQARRDLARTLTGTVSGAFRAGILDGLKGGDDWQASLQAGVRDAIFGAIVDAFVQAAIIESIFAPFLDEFTRLLNRSGSDAAFDFFDANFGQVLENALGVAEEFVRRGQRLFPNTGAGGGIGPVADPTGTIELPNATVTVLAAPQWALELTTAATTIGQAGAAMLDAATLMQATFREGVTVKSTSTRGIDATRAA